MSGVLIEEDLFVKYSIVDNALPEGQKIHEFLLARAKALAGKYIDFEKTPVTFLLSDSDEPNAFFIPVFDPKSKPRKSDYETIRYVRNPIPTPVICVTRGLIDMADTLDQLDFVLGHELTHMIMRSYEVKRNSKGEEEIADLHAVDLMYDAGGDPKQALLMSQKISVYMKEKKKREEYRAHKREKQEGIDWSSIFDVHMTDGNRRSGIEGSLTRLSHLIDERTPSSLDKGLFSVRYTDPVDEFLNAHNYKRKTPLGKLKLLVDCIDQLSIHIPPEQYFQAKLDELEAEDPEGKDYWINDQRKRIQDRIENGYEGYFNGPIVEKKYQQKIASLAEAVIAKLGEDAAQKRKKEPDTPPSINAKYLNIYLQNKAYRHIDKNGYPVVGDLNYLQASGILYSYFYCLFESEGLNRRQPDDPESMAEIDNDIDAAKEKIKTATTAEDFISAAENFKRLHRMCYEIRTVEYGEHNNGEKLDNLSSIGNYRYRRHVEELDVYSEPEGGKIVPWNNLIRISQTNEDTRNYVIGFLDQNKITDYRITHSLPFVRGGYSNCYEVDEAGKLSEKSILDYEVDFAVDRETVLGAYSYIRTYFENEAALIDAACAAAANVDDPSFAEFETTSETFNRRSVALSNIYDFSSMFNALPKEKEKDRFYESEAVVSLIPEHYRKENPVPGFTKEGHPTTSRHFFEFDNPIFQEHFGENFERELGERKNAQQQKMFETAFVVLKKAIDIWLDTDPKVEELRGKVNNIWEELRKLFGEKTKNAKRNAKRKDAEQNALQRQLEFYGHKRDETGSVIHNFLDSIFNGERHWFNLQRLTPEQKREFAEFAVRDEKGAIRRSSSAEHYEFFCDYLGILEGQTERVLSGNYKLTDAMQVVADNYGYKATQTREDLKAFAEENKDKKYRRENKKYAWYLHIFDTMQYLEKTPEIDVRALSTALTMIEDQPRSTNGSAPPDLIEARYRNYRKFVIESNLIALTSRAINHQKNYDDLSFEESMETADRLIEVRRQMENLLERQETDFRGKTEIIIKPEHKKFLDLLDRKTRGLLRKTEQQILEQENALEKISNLYRLYAEGDRYSSERNRRAYLSEMDKKEGRLKKIAALSDTESFWPDDVLDHVKAFVFAKNTFLDDREIEDRVLNTILNKLETTPSGKKKNECLHVLLDKSVRAAYPETRERLFELYTQDVSGKLGKDNGSKTYQKRLALYLKGLGSDKSKAWDVGIRNNKGLLANSISAADKYLVLRKLSDTVLSQEQASQMIKESCQISLGSEDMFKSYLYGIGVDYLTEEMDSDPEMANRFIRFLNSRGEKNDCEEVSAYIGSSMRKKYSGWRDRLDTILNNTKPSNCKVLYENFWSAPLEARAFIIARMLKSAVNTKDTDQTHLQESWERVFDVVMNTVIRSDDESVESKYARDIMHSYIKSRSDYERVLILSAMMVANRNLGSDIGNVGKALKLFLENMGPAEIKLGQAIASHPDTPEDIRKELQLLKNAADMPARWVVYDWIRAENIPEEFWKNEYLGEILGSASYYTTVALGEDKVIRLLRPEAREKATKGFRVIRSTIDDLKEKEGKSELAYDDLTRSVREMVIQAARMSEIETDHKTGERQYAYAKDIYNNVTIDSGGSSFAFKVMDWRAKGKNWIVMDRAKGHTFNALPDKTQEQKDYKKRFAKAYIVFEMTNILSGKKFDHDRHGAQISIDSETHDVGIYDTGAMALNDPSPKDQKLLGNIIHKVLKAAVTGEDAFSSFGHVIGEKIEALHHKGLDTQYLVEVKKGLLALGDFFKILDREDVRNILPCINISTDLSQDVQNGITEKMSLFEKAQFQAFLAMQASKRHHDVVVRRNEKMRDSAVSVKEVDVQPTTQEKSSWLQKVFESPDNGASSRQKGNSHFGQNTCCHELVVG